MITIHMDIRMVAEGECDGEKGNEGEGVEGGDG